MRWLPRSRLKILEDWQKHNDKNIKCWWIKVPFYSKSVIVVMREFPGPYESSEFKKVEPRKR